MIYNFLKRSLFLFILFALLAGCSNPNSNPIPTLTSEGKESFSTDTDPYWPANGWRTSTPEEQGIDSGLLVEMLEFVEDNRYDVDSIVIIRRGYLVADVTFHPYSADETHILYSCTKSVVSSLIGIAIEEEYIDGVDTLFLDIFPEREVNNVDQDKQAMTLEHLLSMTTGFDCHDSYMYDFEGLIEMHESDDWVQHMLDLPMLHPPGTTFEYCNGSSFLLSAVIQETTGMSAHDFAKEHLFAPLGITDSYWEANLQGINYGYSELYLTPKDMAKFGYLYLHDGVWEGEQVVPADWVEISTQEYIPANLQDGYGYQWWIDDAGYYMALGYRGQFIFVLPELDMIVVIVSDQDDGDYEVPEILLTSYILPAVSETPLSENPEAYGLLEEKIEEIANP